MSTSSLVTAATGPALFCGTWRGPAGAWPSGPNSLLPTCVGPALQWLGTRLGLGDRAAWVPRAGERRQGLRLVTQLSQSRQAPSLHPPSGPDVGAPSCSGSNPSTGPIPAGAFRSSLQLGGISYPRAHVLGEGVHDAAGPHVERHRCGLGHRFCWPQRHGRQKQRGPQACTSATGPPSAGRRHVGIGYSRQTADGALRGTSWASSEGHVSAGATT